MFFSALSHFVLRPVPDFGCPDPSCPEFWLSRPVLSLGKIFILSHCPFVPGQKILVLVFFCPGTRAGTNDPGQTPLSEMSRDKMN